ncbi:MAG: chemotaxis protein CheW [Burkholderiaceae bacterium]|nr:chemotaxis protein CheW [Burkholderiaceae bacterium]
MANREALRELQTRLASRLLAARSEGGSVSSWLAVEAAGQRYLLPLGQSGEIFPKVLVQAVPYTQSWFLGVANLRGGLVSVVDLNGFIASLNSPDALAARPTQAVDDPILLSLNADLQVNAALLVDGLAGLRSTDAFVSSEAPIEGTPAFFGTTYIDSSGSRWQELNLQILSQHPTFLSISA